MEVQLSNSQLSKLQRGIALVQQVLSEIDGAKAKSRGASAGARRSGKELAAFKKLIKAERKKGVPVAQLAKMHGVTTSYLYQL